MAHVHVEGCAEKYYAELISYLSSFSTSYMARPASLSICSPFSIPSLLIPCDVIPISIVVSCVDDYIKPFPFLWDFLSFNSLKFSLSLIS